MKQVRRKRDGGEGRGVTDEVEIATGPKEGNSLRGGVALQIRLASYSLFFGSGLPLIIC